MLTKSEVKRRNKVVARVKLIAAAHLVQWDVGRMEQESKFVYLFGENNQALRLAIVNDRVLFKLTRGNIEYNPPTTSANAWDIYLHYSS